MKLLDRDVIFTKITEKQRSKLYRLWQSEMFKMGKLDVDLPSIEEENENDDEATKKAKMDKAIEATMTLATLISVTDAYDKMTDILFPLILVDGMKYSDNFEAIMAVSSPALETVIFATGAGHYLGQSSATKSNQSDG